MMQIGRKKGCTLGEQNVMKDISARDTLSTPDILKPPGDSRLGDYCMMNLKLWKPFQPGQQRALCKGWWYKANVTEICLRTRVLFDGVSIKQLII